MKKRSFVLLIISVMIAVCAVPASVSAASSYQAGSLDELQNILAGSGTSDLSDVSITITRKIAIPDGTTVDLRGCTIISDGPDYVFNLSGSRASLLNGTIKNGGIQVSSDSNQGGTISGVIIKNAPDMGIKISSGSIGDIDGNTISGCGNHGIRLDYGGSAGDIVNNTIKDCRGHGISIYHGSHCGKISYNTLKNIGGKNEGTIGDFGIAVNSGDCDSDSYASEITHNTLDRISYAGIVVLSVRKGSSPSGDKGVGYVSGDIAYNDITHSGTWNKKINWSKGSSYSGHPCEGSVYIDSYGRLHGDIHHNTITEPYDNGICVLAHSSAGSIYSNRISKAHNAGIMVTNNSTVKGSVRSNTIVSPEVYGIIFNNASKGKAVTKNTIKKSGRDGIAVMKGSAVNDISSNTITGAKLYGVISANSKASINTLSANTISVNNSKTGMGILCNSGTSIANITGNKVSGRYTRGIRIKSPVKRISIRSNTVVSDNPKSVHTIPVSVEGCKNKAITITGNSITGNGTGVGIYIQTSSGTVKNNRVKKCSGKVYVVKGSYKVKTS